MRIFIFVFLILCSCSGEESDSKFDSFRKIECLYQFEMCKIKFGKSKSSVYYCKDSLLNHGSVIDCELFDKIKLLWDRGRFEDPKRS